MSCAVCISCLVVVAILGGVSSIPEQQLEVENPTENRDIRSTVIDNNFESRAIKCGKRRIACANAGGKCQSKKDVCEGKLLTAKIYCKNSKTCGCCVPPPPKKGCVFGSTVYSHETYIEDSCMSLQCRDGSWIYTGSISNKCGECQVFGEPHFMTYDLHNISNKIIPTYAYQGEGDYIISQQGLDIPDALFRVTANFIECRAADITCVNSVSYTEPDIEFSFILHNLEHTDHCKFSKDPANDPLCKIKVLVNGRERAIGKSVKSFYATDGTVLVFEHNHIGTDANLNCMNMVGSKGLSVSLCQHSWDYAYLYVWATPPLQRQLYGLCDTFTGVPYAYPIGYTAQNGSLITRLASSSPTSFADSWKIGENPKSNTTLPTAVPQRQLFPRDATKACGHMTPLHPGIQPQTSRAPYAIEYKSKDDGTIHVTVHGSENFQGFFIQARNDMNKPVGFFKNITDEARAITCDNEGDAIHQNFISDKSNIEVIWDPKQFEGTIKFRLTVVQNYATYWTNIMSDSVHVRAAEAMGPSGTAD